MAAAQLIRVTADIPPATLEEVASFFRNLNSVYGYAQYLARCANTSHEPTPAEINEIWTHGYKEASPAVVRIAMGSISIDVLKNPGEWVDAIFLALINLATLPAQIRERWHESQYGAEVFKAKRDELRKSGNITAEEIEPD
ncbi:hypothetical protein ACOKM5_27135 [Streptomyces sp. BH097]|uniref:hypothetical protein n=1 Tax=unclassified Streptomyces TaxID=2593676 RepID=UPI003BB4BA40